MIALYINNIKADIKQGTDISLSKSMGGGDNGYSYSFNLPSTPTNQRIFSALNKLESGNKTFKNYSARLVVDDLTSFDGFVRVDSADKDGYSVNLVGGQSNKLEELLGEDKLNDIKLDDDRYRVIFPNPTRKDIDYSASYTLNSQNKAWFYPFSLWSHPYNVRNNNSFGLYRDFQATAPINLSNEGVLAISQAEQVLLPFFSVQDIVRSIFASKGYNVVGDFFSEHSPLKDLCECFAGKYADYVERHNQRFSVKLSVKDAPTNGRQRELASFDYRTLTATDSESAVKYYIEHVYTQFSSARTGAVVNRVAATEYYTPRDGANTDRMIKQDTDGNYTIKVLKSGWYRINMHGVLAVTNMVRHNGAFLDSCSFDRNMYEINIVKNGNHRMFSGVYTNDSTALGIGYAPICEDGRLTTTSGSDASHFTDNNGKAMPFSLNQTYNGGEVSYNFLRTAQEKVTDSEFERFVGDRKYLKQFLIPENEGTLFVKDKDFVCGVRVGNAHYNEDDGIGNRNKYSSVMNLPILPIHTNVGYNRAIRYGIGGQGIKQNAYKYNGAFTKNSPLKDKAYIRNTSAEIDNNKFESDTHLGNTMLNLCSEKGYTFNRTNNPIAIEGAVPTSWSDLATNPLIVNNIVTNYGGEYYNGNIAKSMIVDRLHYDNLSDTGVTPVDKFTFDTNNVVWLDKDDELDIVCLLPAVPKPNGGDDAEDEYLCPYHTIDVDTQLDYIGESREDWRPTQEDNWETDRYSYMHQYLRDVTAKEYLDDLAKLFNLSINYNTITKEAIISTNSQSNESGGKVDITRFVDFDSVRFESNEEPNKLSILYTDNDKIAEPNKSQSKTLYIGADGEDKEVSTKYEQPVVANITIGNEGTFTAPLIATAEDYNKEYPNDDVFDTSGTNKTRLYFKTNKSCLFDAVVAGGVKVNFADKTKTYDMTQLRFNYLRRLPIMDNKRGAIDLNNPSTIARELHSNHANKEQMICKAYLPLDMYNRIKTNTTIFVSGMAFDVKKIDNYSVTSNRSAELTLIRKY